MVLVVLLKLGLWIGLLTLLLIHIKHIRTYIKRIERFINMKLWRSYHIPHYYYTHKKPLEKKYEKNRIESILFWIALGLIILGILAILGVFS